MNSYASIDRLEGQFAVCEVELINLESARSTSFVQKPTKMMNFPTVKFPVRPAEGDIFIVNHDGNNINSVLYRDDYEKQRRVAIIGALISRFKK